MRADNLHIIQKQSIEIIFDTLDDSKGLQNQIAQIFYEKIQPRMEVLFDEMFSENQFASIDRLEIDLGSLNLKNWEQKFTEQTIFKLKDELIQANKNETGAIKIKETTASETFFFYLENGFLPWNKRIDSIAKLEQLIHVSDDLIGRLKNLIQHNGKVAERLAYQFSEEFNVKVITAFTERSNKETDSLSIILEHVGALQDGKFGRGRIERHLVDGTLLKMFASGESKNRELQFFTLLLTKTENNADLRTEIKEIVNKLHVHSEKQSPATGENLPESELLKAKGRQVDSVQQGNQDPGTSNSKPMTESPESPQTIYIRNAGLVLLHPFLPALLEHLNLIKENIWIDESSQQKAVLLLEFLVTGKEEMEEFDLMLNKILCGIEIDEIAPTETDFDSTTYTECDNLLNAVIQHWEVLKNTSITGLRETFLQRNGKLSKVDDGWRLQVEQKAFDILLNQLPWGIGIIKLPWMNEMLYVEWT